MRRITLLFPLLTLLLQTPLSAQTESRTGLDARMQWWREARFGMFIHWGLYAVPAGEWDGNTGYGEWIRHSARIPLETYRGFQTQFNPVRFHAREWVRTARNAGMRYMVVTAKHHDGFCMFDTKHTGFNIMETPFGRDPLKELAEACREFGLKLCFYYSIMDWNHPDYLPRRDWETDRNADSADFNRYLHYMKGQLSELLTNYGEIGVLWFDGEWEGTWNDRFGKEIYAFVRQLQPGIIVNNRVGAGRMDLEGMSEEGAFGGDFGTPEQQVPPAGMPGTDWESCMTMNHHWGFNKADTDYKSSTELIRTLTDIASKGGNFLLNVGPTAEGTLPPVATSRLQEIGNWMKVNGESIHGTQASPFSSTPWGRCTMRAAGDTVFLYLHLFDWPQGSKLTIQGCLNDPLDAILLGEPEYPLPLSREDERIIVSLPDQAPDHQHPVVRLSFLETPDIIHPPVIIADNDLFVDRMVFELASGRPDVEIRFTGNGTDPVDTSFLYSHPLEIRGGATVKARCFRDGKPVSGTATRTFTGLLPATPKHVENPVPGIRYQYLEGDWDSLPDFSTLRPVKSGIVPYFVLDPREQDERFAFVYTGYILIPRRGLYTFYTASDDGSRLYIGKRLLVDNDGLHGSLEKEGSVGLNAGFHPIRIEFFEKTGGEELKVYCKGPDLPKQEVPREWLVHEGMDR